MPVSYTHLDVYKRQALNGDKETLILYTCYPNNTLSLTPYRFIAYCEKADAVKVACPV